MNLGHIKKCFDDLKRAQRKANALKVELKKARENLIFTDATLSKEHKSSTIVVATTKEEVTLGHDVMDKTCAKRDKALEYLGEL